jgi:hypothetical protein
MNGLRHTIEITKPKISADRTTILEQMDATKRGFLNWRDDIEDIRPVIKVNDAAIVTVRSAVQQLLTELNNLNGLSTSVNLQVDAQVAEAQRKLDNLNAQLEDYGLEHWNLKSDESIIFNVLGKKQMGGPISTTGLYMLHAGEYVTPANQVGTGFNGSISVTVNLNTTINSELDVKRIAKIVGDEISRDIERRVGAF